MKKHTLKIEYVDKIPAQNSYTFEDAAGTFLMGKRVSRMYILKTKDHRDTLLHEMCHFILGIVTGNWQGHGAKFRKLYKLLKLL